MLCEAAWLPVPAQPAEMKAIDTNKLSRATNPNRFIVFVFLTVLFDCPRSGWEHPKSGNPFECDIVKVELLSDYRYLQSDSIVTKII
jgi:hypothetical protein